MILYLMHLVTVIIGFAMVGVLIVKVTLYRETFNRIERWGMALASAMTVLRAPAILQSPETTPFSDWSTLVFMAGLLMMHAGRLVRLRRHAKANERAVDAARAWRDGKG